MSNRIFNDYVGKGFETRSDYLYDLCRMYGVEEDVVFTLAHNLGPMEDFDGLITAIENIVY